MVGEGTCLEEVHSISLGQLRDRQQRHILSAWQIKKRELTNSFPPHRCSVAPAVRCVPSAAFNGKCEATWGNRSRSISQALSEVGSLCHGLKSSFMVWTETTLQAAIPQCKEQIWGGWNNLNQGLSYMLVFCLSDVYLLNPSCFCVAAFHLFQAPLSLIILFELLTYLLILLCYIYYTVLSHFMLRTRISRIKKLLDRHWKIEFLCFKTNIVVFSLHCF